MNEHTIPATSRAEQLIGCGDPRQTRRWSRGEPDYPRMLGLGPEDVPELIAIARTWLDDGSDDPDDTTWYAPVHAWRALAQLRAPEAVAMMLEMIGPMEARGDDWYLEEFPDAFALIGRAALDPVTAYLADESHAEFPRVCAVDALWKVAKGHGDLRDEIVRRLMSQLSGHERNSYTLNGFLIGRLDDLRATEAAEMIELAFAAGRVDESVAGDWHDVRASLGVEGMGLVPPRPRPAAQPPGSTWSDGTVRSFKSRKSAERKRERAARKRGRKR